ncbi:MAG: hypothetical protein ABI416_04705 [Ginsengibacter sp.]
MTHFNAAENTVAGTVLKKPLATKLLLREHFRLILIPGEHQYCCGGRSALFDNIGGDNNTAIGLVADVTSETHLAIHAATLSSGRQSRFSKNQNLL